MVRLLLFFLVVVYPVSFADADGADKVALKVIESTVEAPGVEKQCQGTFLVRNIGPAFRVPPTVVGPSYGVFIYDANDELLFRNYGGWGTGMEADNTIRLRWNTSSNHLGETSEPPFLVPAPGRYRLEIVLSMGLKRERILHVHSKWFEVPAAMAGADLGGHVGKDAAEILRQRYDAFVEALDKKRIATDYPKAVQKLDSPDPRVQIAGIKTLAATGEVEAIPWIVPLLDSNERHVRICAGQALNALVASHELKRRDKSQPERVVILPPGPGDTDLAPMAWVILNMLRKPDDGNTHAFAANMTGYLRLDPFEGDLRQLLKSRHPAVTRAARHALEMLDADQPSKIHSLEGTVIEKQWTKSYESWNAGGSEYYVLDIGQGKLPQGSRSAKEGVILRPSKAVSFEQFKRYKGKQVIVKGKFVEAKPYKPVDPHEQIPGDRVEQYPVEPTVTVGPDGRPILGPSKPAPRGSGFQVYEIQPVQQSDVAPKSKAAISTEQLRKSLKASKEELQRRESGEGPRWTIPTDLLLKRVQEYEAMLRAREAEKARTAPQPKKPRSDSGSAVKGPDQATIRAVKTLLPAGWSVHRDGASLVITRDEPVEFYNTINLPANSGIDELRTEGFTHKTGYALTLRFGSHVTGKAYERMVAENSETTTRMAVMRDRMRHITHKFDSYLPDTPEEKELVDEYVRLKKSLHELPDYHDEQHSVWACESVDWPCAFASEKVGHECAAVRDKVLAGFEKYATQSDQ